MGFGLFIIPRELNITKGISLTARKKENGIFSTILEKYGRKGNINTIKKMVSGRQNLKMAKLLWREIML